MTKYIIGAILCVAFIVWGLWQKANEDKHECRGCKHNNMGSCESPILCEDYEMWEPEEWKNDRR